MRSFSSTRIGSVAWGCLAGSLALTVMGAFTALVTTGRADDAPKAANFTQKIDGSSVAFDMVAIPGGKFKMGTPDSEAGRKDDEGPQHEVELAPFFMGKTEVTWDEFDQYWKVEGQPMARPDETDARKADAITRPTPPYADETFGHGREGNPVICITHHTAMEYCRWLSRKTGRWYRLPTEAEWEYACRAGTSTAYSYGDDASKLGDYAWFAGNSEELAHPVGKKKANPWGLHDMHGNACEWCLDHYEKDTYSKLAGKLSVRPVVMPTEKRFSHVARGGSWADPAPMLRSGARRGSDKTWIKLDPQRPQSIWWLTSAEFVGFRVVSPVKEQAEMVDLRSKVTRQSQ
ncbi:MAG: formylglycine-generating enzyme family protein [Gemmataceae bacterium]|nr:formylglycine-generating enzyme family protein [Gemmataceae bacterium]